MRIFVAFFLLASSCAACCLTVAPAVRAAEPSAKVAFLGRTRSLTGIDDVLAKPISLQFRSTPLRDVLAVIQDKADVTLTADGPALDNAGYDLDTIVVTWQGELSLASSLDALCEFLDLKWIVQDDIIEITTPEAAAARQMARMIDVTDITDDPESLVDLLQSAVEPHGWARHGGQAAITSDRTREASTLIVTHAWQGQRGVAGVIDRLRRCVAAPRAEHAPLGVGGYWSDAAHAEAARKALAAPMTLDIVATPLRDFVAWVSDKAGVPVTLDWPVLCDSGIDLDEVALTGSGRGLRLTRLLERLLTPHGLTWDLHHDRLTITTLEAANARHSVAIYPLGDLLDEGRSASQLIDNLRATVTPVAWETVGGEAFIRAFSPRKGGSPCALVVRHNSAGHRAVGDFLQQLPR